MRCFSRTFVRLSAENRLRLDRFRRHQALTRDRIVNQIVSDFFNAFHTETTAQLRRKKVA